MVPSPIVPKLNSSERKNIFRERLLRARGCFARAEVICARERLFARTEVICARAEIICALAVNIYACGII